MTDPRVVLDAIQARAYAATDGPWVPLGQRVVYDTGSCNCGPSGVNGLHEDYCGAEWLAEAAPDDAAFIAAARTDVPALVAALGAVLDLADKAEQYERKYIATDSLAGEIWHGDLRAVIAEHLGGAT